MPSRAGAWLLLRAGWGKWDSCDPSLTSQIPTRTLTVTCRWKMTRVVPMLLPTHQTARKRRKRPPSLASRAGTACWVPELRDCPFTVPPRVGQHQGCSHWGASEALIKGQGFLENRAGVVAVLTVYPLWDYRLPFFDRWGSRVW